MILENSPLYRVFDFFGSCISKLYEVLSVPILHNITLTDIFIGFICLSILISVFWKGARG